MAAPLADLDLTPDTAGLEGVLAAIAGRVDVLSSTTVTFRQAVVERVSELFARTAELIADHAKDNAEIRQDIRRSLDAIEEIGEVAAQTMADLASHRSEVMGALEAIAEEVRGLRRRTTVRADRPARLDPHELEEIADAVAASLRRDAGPATPRARRARNA
jgi:hypothetical protein